MSDSLECISKTKVADFSLVVLGTVQDGGSPHINCKKACCKGLYGSKEALNRKVVSLGLIDKITGETFLFEATPDISTQVKMLWNFSGNAGDELPEAIFVTHAHIGHYSGLMFLGKEACNANAIPVYAMPRMKTFLENNGPWSQLVGEKNIVLNGIQDGISFQVNAHYTITALQVPHRDEFSETIGYIIQGPNKKLLFIPDIDKWEKWNKSIVETLKTVDYAFIDATFYSGEEIKQRDISKIPHPFVIETMQLFEKEDISIRNKIHFIHFNHSNPLLDKQSKAYKEVRQKGFKIAAFGDILAM